MRPGLPSLTHEFELDPARTALLVVDLQRVDADPACGLGVWLAEHQPEVHDWVYGRIAEQVVPNTRALLERFRGLGRPVVYLTNGSELDGYADYLPRRRGRVRETGFIPRVGTPEYAILDAVAPQAGELVLVKRSTSGFSSTALDQLLRNLDVSDLVVVGVATDACVGLTAADAADRGYGVVLVGDATATYTAERQDAFEALFGTVWGQVRTTAEVMALLAG